METYQTEEQQVEAIKKLWKEYGNVLIAGIVIGLGGFVGFNFYKDSKLAEQYATSDAFLQLVEQEEGVDQAQTEAFVAEHGDSSYASLSALAAAKKAVEAEDWALAKTNLETAVAKAQSEGIKAIATVRLARVEIQLEQYDQALATLGAQFPESFVSIVEETKGDAYIKQGNTEQARVAYQAALDASEQGMNAALQMKLDDLAQADVLQ
ncbi:YfgM family protein [Thalassotalea agarivorans]|uniref:Ancillary SecYEG translocon subunit n=1 Tax=Thalassotalea agarivorans TaxID=349064 RepID=A0A1H9YFS6_THASX|nr:tetratricopeptide repeat protein [Thalassotalea agarivorans]SES67295.1 Putative negative regulator of RcsB-dependent stress response [Thalassotalea agarivorans]